jgi:hypothetical protein
LAFKYFPTRKEMNDWCLARLKQLRDLAYREEQGKKRQLKKEERKAWEAKQERRRNDLLCWEYYIAKAQENNRHLRDSDCVGKSTDVWPPPSPE